MREGRISCACVVLLLLLFLIQQRRPAQWRWKSSPIWWRGANYAIGRASRSRRLPLRPGALLRRERERAAKCIVRRRVSPSSSHGRIMCIFFLLSADNSILCGPGYIWPCLLPLRFRLCLLWLIFYDSPRHLWI